MSPTPEFSGIWRHVGRVGAATSARSGTLTNSPRAAGAKRLARTSRRAVHMASSSYRPLPQVPLTQYWRSRGWGCLLPGTVPSTVTLLTPGHESENLSGETTVLLFTRGSNHFLPGSNRWMRHSFSMLRRRPYGAAAFKVSVRLPVRR